ncbi:MAG TPA: VWA domain-containing protein [Bacteroidales bacterium]|nr:VWA domain-containing protein [Bacteroidales bacterium]HPS16354.1 VWA domain-containing protein [Bacteroidales bacterium]
MLSLFAHPALLILIPVIIPLMAVWYWFRHKQNNADIQVSDTSVLKKAPRTLRQRMYHGLFILRMLAVILIIIAIARPQTSSSGTDISVEGIDIVMAMDISGTMLAEDFKPNRLEASKQVAMDFIDGRPNDRIGLVVFSGEAFTQCPLTTDHAVMKNLFKDIYSGMIDDGTAIGDGLATAVNRLRKSEAVSKVIILLTDGINNTGAIDPTTAAEIAKLYGIRLYTIGVGTLGMAPYPFKNSLGGITYQNVDVKIDETLLNSMAELTGGKYFRATNKAKLEEIYKEIDKLEKSKIDETSFNIKTEKFLPFVLAALALLLIELFSRYLIYRSIP